MNVCKSNIRRRGTPRARGAALFGLLLFVALGAFGCEQKKITQIVLEMDAPVAVRSLKLEIYDYSGTSPGLIPVFTQVYGGGDGVVLQNRIPSPWRFTLVKGRVVRAFLAVATAEIYASDGQIRTVRKQARAAFAEDSSRALRFFFDEPCIDYAYSSCDVAGPRCCRSLESCSAGRCEAANFEGADLIPFDSNYSFPGSYQIGSDASVVGDASAEAGR